MSNNCNIHSSAIISEKAEIGDNVSIGAYCVIGDNVKIASNCEIKPHVVIEGDTSIGENTVIFPFASIGLIPQDLKFKGEKSTLVIGSNCTIREHVTINPGTETGVMETRIGNNCLLMVGVHVAHDCVVGNNVIMANNATLAGHVQVGDNAIIGGLSAVHQFIRIGENAMIGGMSGVEADVIPFGLVKGERAFLAGLNIIGMERKGIDRSEIRTVQKAFSLLFSEEGNHEDRLEKLSREYSGNALIEKILGFAKEKTGFPLCRPPRRK